MFQITVGVLSIFAIILSLLKAWIYCKRNLANELNISLLLWFLTYCLSYIGNVLLLVTISTCICTFIFYKGQTVLHIPLPNDVDEMTIHLCTIIAFCFKVRICKILLFKLFVLKLKFGILDQIIYYSTDC